MKKFYFAAPAIIAAIIGRVLHMELLTFVAAMVSMLPLAALMGEATEELANHTGPRLGGFLNATLGNAAELIIALFLIAGGELEVVKASLTGSIIANILLVLGASLLVGGLNHGEQKFDSQVAGMHSASMVLAVTGLMMASLFHQVVPGARFIQVETVSIGVAIVLMSVYVASVVFSFKGGTTGPAAHTTSEAKWSRAKATWVLVAATALVIVSSEMLVHSLEAATARTGLSKLFIGLILVPLVGNAAEHASAIILAGKNKVDIAIEIAAGSSAQIALFVAPVLVIASLALGNPMDLFFSGFEIAAVAVATAIAAIISLDGRSNWLEGVQLLGAYAVMVLSFLFLPSGAG